MREDELKKRCLRSSSVNNNYKLCAQPPNFLSRISLTSKKRKQMEKLLEGTRYDYSDKIKTPFRLGQKTVKKTPDECFNPFTTNRIGDFYQGNFL